MDLLLRAVDYLLRPIFVRKTVQVRVKAAPDNLNLGERGTKDEKQIRRH
jgi:hypothetical protein